MDKAGKIITDRLNYFKERKPDEIYNLYHSESDFCRFFSNRQEYINHFFNLININEPESIEFYKILYNNEKAEVLYLERVKDKERGNIVEYYTKTFLQEESGVLRIIEEKREKVRKG